MSKKYFYLLGMLLLATIATVVLWKITTKHAPNAITVHNSHNTPLPKQTTIILDKNGFSPKEVTIAIGSAVRWKNVSGSQQTVNSDNYPTNQLHTELNLGTFNSGSTVVYIFTKPGVYGYHNQFHHEQQGKINVQ